MSRLRAMTGGAGPRDANESGRGAKGQEESDLAQKVEKRPAANRLVRADWVAAAKDILIADGIKGLSLRRLATSLNMTTGGFYWLFDNFEELLDDLRTHWEVENSRHFNEIFESTELDSKQKYIGYLRILFNVHLYQPSYDNAMRDWARSSPETAALIEKVDARRILQLKNMYLGFGYIELTSLVKAEIAYFHQVGYYMVGVNEDVDIRLSKIPYYADLIYPGIIPLDIPLDDLKALILVDPE